MNKTADTLPKFQTDYMCIRTVAQSKAQPCITFVETRSGVVISFMCARKGGYEDLTKEILRHVEAYGFLNKVIIQCDKEMNIIDVCRKVARERNARTVLRFAPKTSHQSNGFVEAVHGHMQGVAPHGAVALNSADFATVALNSVLFIHLSIHPRYFFLFLLREIVLFFSLVRPSMVHNSQHVWLMFDTESQLFLTHGKGFGLDSNDGGSLESGPDSRLDDCGYRQKTLLERGLGESVSQCLS